MLCIFLGEATQTKPQNRGPSLGCFALIAMTVCGERHGIS